jgi:hypothetical protein
MVVAAFDKGRDGKAERFDVSIPESVGDLFFEGPIKPFPDPVGPWFLDECETWGRAPELGGPDPLIS